MKNGSLITNKLLSVKYSKAQAGKILITYPTRFWNFSSLKVNHFSLIKDIPLKILAIDGNLLDQQLVTTFGQLNLDLLEIELINGIYRDEKNLPNDRSGNRLVPLNWTDFNAKGQTKVKLEMMPNFCESDKSLYVRFEFFRYFAIREITLVHGNKAKPI